MASTDKNLAVFGIYSTRVAAENVTDSLVRSGFPASDVSILLPENLGGLRDVATEKSTKAPEGAAAGATTGGVIGGTLGLLDKTPQYDATHILNPCVTDINTFEVKIGFLPLVPRILDFIQVWFHSVRFSTQYGACSYSVRAGNKLGYLTTQR